VPDDLLIVEEVQILAVDDDSSVLQEVVEEVVVVSEAVQGPPGPPGISGGANFSHTQAVASDTWTVNHSLGFRPAVSILSVGGKEMWAEVIHTSVNQFIAYFDAPTSGIAICS
jgi:hypothetical protein